MLWRRKQQPTPVSLPGKSHGRRSLVGCSLCSHKRAGHGWAAEHARNRNWAHRPLSASPSIPQTPTAGFLHLLFFWPGMLFPSYPQDPISSSVSSCLCLNTPWLETHSEPALIKQITFLTLDMPCLAHIALSFSCQYPPCFLFINCLLPLKCKLQESSDLDVFTGIPGTKNSPLP